MREPRLIRRALLVAGAAVAALGLTSTGALADDWGQRVPGTHVYDLAGALTSAQVSDLEQSAAAVDQAGAPTVVYLRRKDASDTAARQDARALMDTWAVESAPGRKDGFVLLLDLRPADIRHGSAALVAGQAHGDRLDGGRLQSIYDETMKPRLAAGDLAGALSAALGQVAADLKGPAPSATSGPSAGAVAGLLFGLGALVVIALLAGMVIRSNRTPGRGGPTGQPGADSTHTDHAGSGAGTYFGGVGGASSGSSSGGGSF
jgi:uncharacterized membrane protein YgcG